MNVRPLRHSSVRPSPIFLVIVGVTVLGGVLAWLAAADGYALYREQAERMLAAKEAPTQPSVNVRSRHSLKWTDDLIADGRALLDAGHTYNQIAERLGGTVAAWRQAGLRFGWPRRNGVVAMRAALASRRKNGGIRAEPLPEPQV